KEPGDGGIDQFGGYRGYTILGQCKNYPEPGSIGPQYVRDLEGVLSRYHKNTTIGLLVAPSKASFSKNTINRANSSEYIIILTDITNAYSDLVRFVGSQPPVVFQQTRSSIHWTRKIFEKVIEIF
ncbi:9298_t:CDS:2, partial [Gigaspora rosea]